jgi:hypothetical protein
MLKSFWAADNDAGREMLGSFGSEILDIAAGVALGGLVVASIVGGVLSLLTRKTPQARASGSIAEMEQRSNATLELLNSPGIDEILDRAIVAEALLATKIQERLRFLEEIDDYSVYYPNLTKPYPEVANIQIKSVIKFMGGKIFDKVLGIFNKLVGLRPS